MLSGCKLVDSSECWNALQRHTQNAGTDHGGRLQRTWYGKLCGPHGVSNSSHCFAPNCCAQASSRLLRIPTTDACHGSRQRCATRAARATDHLFVAVRMLLANLSIMVSVSFPNVGGSPKGCEVSQTKKINDVTVFSGLPNRIVTPPCVWCGNCEGRTMCSGVACSSLRVWSFERLLVAEDDAVLRTITNVIPSKAALSCCQRGASRGSRFRHCRFYLFSI